MDTLHTQTPQSSIKHVRVTVPVAPHVLEAFKRLSAASGLSLGRTMGEWLADTVDGVEVMSGLCEKARAAPRMAVQELHSYALGLSDLTSQLVQDIKNKAGGPVAGTGKRSADPATGPMALGDIFEEAKRLGDLAVTPPSVIRGVKSPKPPKTKGKPQ